MRLTGTTTLLIALALTLCSVPSIAIESATAAKSVPPAIPTSAPKKQAKPIGHTKEISLFVVSRDGSLAVSADDDENNYIWDMKNGGKLVREIGRPEAVKIRVVAAAFSPDSTQLLWARNGKIMPVLWDVESGRRIGVLSSKEKGHGAPIVAVTFSQDGRYIATGDTQGTIVIWNRADRSVVKRVKAHNGEARYLMFLNSKNELASAGTDGAIHIWTVAGGDQPATLLEPSESAVTALTGSTDGQFLYAALADMTVKGWMVSQRSLRGTLDFGNRMINSIALSPDGDFMAIAEEDQSVLLWNIRESKVAWRNDLDDSATQVLFSGDGKRLITSGGDNWVRIWDVASGTLVKSFAGVAGE